MNVLSLFDGMSCGQIALERSGLRVKKYFASEIDKFAIKVTQNNYPNTIQLGSVENWNSWRIPKIDLILAGSPCQGFSFAGKQLNFDDPRSKLFFTFVDILESIKPKYWLLENVLMKREYENIISSKLNIDPIMIDSSLVSAQSRKRLYWTNIRSEVVDFFGRKKSQIQQPKDKKIFLKDIIENGFVDREKSCTIVASEYKGCSSDYYLENSRRQIVFIDQRPRGKNKGGKHYFKCPTITSGEFVCNNKLFNGKDYRKLTPLECERLQTVPENYTNHVSNTQRMKMLGNGWTVDVIAHILKHINQ